MLSLEIGLRRLLSCERECRRQAEVALGDTTKDELTKLADTFHDAVIERQVSLPAQRD